MPPRPPLLPLLARPLARPSTRCLRRPPSAASHATSGGSISRARGLRCGPPVAATSKPSRSDTGSEHGSSGSFEFDAYNARQHAKNPAFSDACAAAAPRPASPAAPHPVHAAHAASA